MSCSSGGCSCGHNKNGKDLSIRFDLAQCSSPANLSDMKYALEEGELLDLSAHGVPQIYKEFMSRLRDRKHTMLLLNKDAGSNSADKLDQLFDLLPQQIDAMHITLVIDADSSADHLSDAWFAQAMLLDRFEDKAGGAKLMLRTSDDEMCLAVMGGVWDNYAGCIFVVGAEGVSQQISVLTLSAV